MTDKKRIPFTDHKKYIKTVKAKLEMEELEGLEHSEQYMKIMAAKNLATKERMYTIEKIFELYPNLKKDSEMIKNHVLGLKGRRDLNEMVLDKIVIDGVSYYIDKRYNILNVDTELVGCYVETDDYYVCFMKVKDDRNLDMYKRVDVMCNEIDALAQ